MIRLSPNFWDYLETPAIAPQASRFAFSSFSAWLMVKASPPC
jgi:hypothetical protein